VGIVPEEPSTWKKKLLQTNAGLKVAMFSDKDELISFHRNILEKHIKKQRTQPKI
jgi:hypothetical protein